MSIATELPTENITRSRSAVSSDVRVRRSAVDRSTTAARRRAAVQRRRYVQASGPQGLGHRHGYSDACVEPAPHQPISWLAAVAGVVGTALVILGFVALANLRAESIDAAASSAVSGATEVSVSAGSQPVVVTVQEGETISDVARRIAPGQPVQPVVEGLLPLGDMPGAAVSAGQQLATPLMLGQ